MSRRREGKEGRVKRGGAEQDEKEERRKWEKERKRE